MPAYDVKVIHNQSGLSFFFTHESEIPLDKWDNDESLFTEVLNDLFIIPLGPTIEGLIEYEN